jgi:hypothetical protein
MTKDIEQPDRDPGYYSHCDKGPASRPTRTRHQRESCSTRVRASGSLGTFISRQILPASSTMQMEVALTETPDRHSTPWSASPSDACGCLAADHVYHQPEAHNQDRTPRNGARPNTRSVSISVHRSSLQWTQVKKGLDPSKYTIRTVPGLVEKLTLAGLPRQRAPLGGRDRAAWHSVMARRASADLRHLLKHSHPTWSLAPGGRTPEGQRPTRSDVLARNCRAHGGLAGELRSLLSRHSLLCR